MDGAASDAGRVPSAVGGIHWNKRVFTSAETLRNTLAGRSISWEAFLRLHPPAAKSLHLTAVEYGERFYTTQALRRWLAAHHQRYDRWAAAHPAAAARLESQPDDTAVGDRLALRAKRADRDPRTLRVLAHAFPGARARVVVRAAGSGRLAAVATVVNYDGSVDSLVPLRRAETHRNLVVSFTAVYPEGPRTVRTIIRSASRVPAAKNR
jgi:hypothetical protein